MNIKINKLIKKFNGNTIIDIEDFEFKSNNIYGLYGRNGSGKTILLKLICNYYTPTSGDILINNINYNENNEFPENTRASIGEPNFYNDLNAYENLEILAKIQNIIGEKEINESLKIVNLDEKNKVFKNFSLGMKQKLSIAQAIMEKPKLLILDEPFNGVERATVDKISKYLKEYINEDTIIIISSHIKDDLKNVCTKYVSIEDGKLYECKNIDEI